jgi:putative ABC transport system permease protein
VIVNAVMAKRYWPNGDPLTDQIVVAKGLGPTLEEPPRQIVGVVGDVRDLGLNREPQPIMYVPWPQLGDAQTANMLEITPLAWIVRTRVEPHGLSRPMQDELRRASGGLPVARIRTMEEVVARSTARADFNMRLLTIFAGAALLLASIGIYGLMAYVVEQRTQEIGVRLALGADAPRVRNMIVGQGMRLAVVGVAIGVGSALGLTRVIATLLYGVTTHDPLVFVGVPVALAAVVLVSVYVPACRAARIDPIE